MIQFDSHLNLNHDLNPDMMQFAPRPTSAMAALPTKASFGHFVEANEATLLSPRERETLYEKLPSRGRPLSYTEILRHWTRAVIKKQHVGHSMEDAQEEYEDYASDIIAVVGQAEYDNFLASLLNAIEQCSTRSTNVQHPIF